VIAKNQTANQLVIGPKQATEVREFLVDKLQLINLTEQELLKQTKPKVRIRNIGKLVDCSIIKQLDSFQIKLNQPLEGIAAGQSAVFYTSDQPNKCLGGAIIF